MLRKIQIWPHNLQEALVVLSALLFPPDPYPPVSPSHQNYRLYRQHPTHNVNINILKQLQYTTTEKTIPVSQAPHYFHHDQEDPVIKSVID